MTDPKPRRVGRGFTEPIEYRDRRPRPLLLLRKGYLLLRGKAGQPLLEVAPSSAMTAYKLYCLDDQGHITSRIEFVGDCDEAAIAHVRQHHFDSACEIWDLARLVVRMPRNGPSSGY
jgi:hypothetical protein